MTFGDDFCIFQTVLSFLSSPNHFVTHKRTHCVYDNTALDVPQPRTNISPSLEPIILRARENYRITTCCISSTPSSYIQHALHTTQDGICCLVEAWRVMAEKENYENYKKIGVLCVCVAAYIGSMHINEYYECHTVVGHCYVTAWRDVVLVTQQARS